MVFSFFFTVIVTLKIKYGKRVSLFSKEVKMLEV